ncbi:antitoxin [Candidatus Bathyarchaeota archaeon]|nr:MAG: antitoxin [Candidatus Bathyarchaeota archaeon]
MPGKTITISREAYEALLKEMRPGETPSDVILRLVRERRKSLLEFAGKWTGDPEELVKAIKELRRLWRKWGAQVR